MDGRCDAHADSPSFDPTLGRSDRRGGPGTPCRRQAGRSRSTRPACAPAGHRLTRRRLPDARPAGKGPPPSRTTPPWSRCFPAGSARGRPPRLDRWRVEDAARLDRGDEVIPPEPCDACFGSLPKRRQLRGKDGSPNRTCRSAPRCCGPDRREPSRCRLKRMGQEISPQQEAPRRAGHQGQDRSSRDTNTLARPGQSIQGSEATMLATRSSSANGGPGDCPFILGTRSASA